jgi:hypothetical protein
MERKSSAAACVQRRDQPIDAGDIELLSEFCEATDVLSGVTDRLGLRVAHYVGLPVLLKADELTELRKLADDALVDLRAITRDLEALREAIS